MRRVEWQKSPCSLCKVPQGLEACVCVVFSSKAFCVRRLVRYIMIYSFSCFIILSGLVCVASCVADGGLPQGLDSLHPLTFKGVFFVGSCFARHPGRWRQCASWLACTGVASRRWNRKGTCEARARFLALAGHQTTPRAMAWQP